MSTVLGGEIVVRSLRRCNIDRIFGLVGNVVSPIFVHAKKHGMKIVDTRHEQGAVHMADGWSQTTRNVGVAVVVGGPGFTNSITGIVKAFMANTPLLLIAGATVPEERDVGGVLEMDQVGLIRNYTRWAASVYEARRIPEYIDMALKRAVSGVMGPVFLEIPINILRAQIEESEVQWTERREEFVFCHASQETVDKIYSYISSASRPLMIAGNEIYYCHGEKALLEFVEASGIPVVTVNKARGCISDHHPLCMGNGRILDAGPQLDTLTRADVIINAGLSVDYQMACGKPPFFNESKVLININRDIACNLRVTKTPGISVVADPGTVLADVCKKIKSVSHKNDTWQNWVNKLRENKAAYLCNLLQQSEKYNHTIHPVKLINDIMSVINSDDIIVLDGSNAMFWGSELFKFTVPGQIINGPDGSLGPIGCGVPLALAAKLAYPKKNVILYTGDGSFGFNAIEMDTAIRLQIPIVVVIHNDQAWGFCKSSQEAQYGGEYVAACHLGMRPYEKIVQAMGGYGEFVDSPEKIVPALKNGIDSHLPSCINVLVDQNFYAPGSTALNETIKKWK